MERRCVGYRGCWRCFAAGHMHREEVRCVIARVAVLPAFIACLADLHICMLQVRLDEASSSIQRDRYIDQDACRTPLSSARSARWPERA